MNPISIINRLDLKQAIGIARLALWYPLWIFPTGTATRHCIAICDRDFGMRHSADGPANAFRHALWNFMIAHYCLKWRFRPHNVLQWTEKITDWHEKTFPNPDSARTMDLHNNAVGRVLFTRYREKPLPWVVDHIKGMLEEAVPLGGIQDLDAYPDTLVYLERPER